MRDGVQLATDLYWPAGIPLEQLPPRPVLLERTPYGIRANRRSDGRHADGSAVTPESGAAYFVARGYLVIRQDCRGQGDSEGVFSKYVGEAADGFDTHAWIADNGWCDGRIVSHGVSYSAHTQAAAASVGAAPMTAMVMDSGGFSNAFEAGGRFGGAFELKQVIWALRRAGNDDAETVLDRDQLRTWFAALPWRKGFSPLSGSPDYEDFVFEQWSHEVLDDFWRQPGLYARGHYRNFPAVPVLNISSWYDPYVFTAVENHQAAVAKDLRSCLVLGPWTHGARSLTHSGDVDFGPEATLDGNLASDYLRFKADWLETALSQQVSGSLPPAGPDPVRYFLMGGGSGRTDSNGRMMHGGSWRRADQWPPEQAEPMELYLHSDQSLSTRPPGSDDGSISYDFDPATPVPSIGGGITSGEPMMSGGAFDQTPAEPAFGHPAGLPLSARRDVLTFQTAPLPASVAVAGPVTVALRFSSDAPDTDVTAKLVDVYPPSADYPRGFAMNVTDGMLRCRYRNDFSHPEKMSDGETYRLTIRLPDTANLFAAGHRIRLDISSSNFPRCDVNPNTGGPVMGDRTSRVARNTVHLGGSTLQLSVLPDQR